jgi:ABC-type cobalamin/Fe3+-siderophores transport system ATPase subunit
VNQSRPIKLEASGVRLAFYNERMKRQLPVLSGIDLSVREGELVAIVGPSGCGKSTFLSAVDGLVKISGGDIKVDGKRVERPGPDRAVVFQQDSLFPVAHRRRATSPMGSSCSAACPKSKFVPAPSPLSISSVFPVLPSIIRTSSPVACASA